MLQRTARHALAALLMAAGLCASVARAQRIPIDPYSFGVPVGF